MEAVKRTVYLVSTGEYSDYYVVAAFDTEELAQAYADEMNKRCGKTVACSSGYGVEECAMNPSPPTGEYIREGYKAFWIAMDKNGDTVDHRVIDGCRFLEDSGIHDLGDRITTQVVARDLKHAVKIVNEKRAMLLANR